ncbi:MAG: HemK/PrmC family methyltransferase [Bacteriovorax sp.]|nr:HemK/PrmC family methyltransferase [Bacteriovorax sp.]
MTTKRSITSLEVFLQSFFKDEKKLLLANYPGLTLHRLRDDIKLHAFLNGVDSEELFDFPYIPYHSNPITLFFEKLKLGVPLEYITGYAYFYRSLYKVTPDVLIPRSETEILVELATLEIQKNYSNRTCRLIDVGTGSGIIALTLMMEDFATLEVVASDISEEALILAQENLFNLHYTISAKHSVKFIKSDRLKDIEGNFDIILSNPPYIKRLLDRGSVHHQVLSYEPEMALFLDDESYDIWFEDFFKSIYQKLNQDGLSLIEGHELYLEGLAEKAIKIGFSKVEVIKDYTGRNRFLRLKK